MKIHAATPYLIVGGQAERAIALYERVFDAKTVDLKRFGDFDESCPEALKERVMHAALQLGDALLMLSDGPQDFTPSAPNSVHVALDFRDAAQMHQCFDRLAEGGQVVQPIFNAPWGGLFGAVTDELSVEWMFSCPTT